MAGTQGGDDLVIHLVTEKTDLHKSREAELRLKWWAVESDLRQPGFRLWY